MVRFSFAAVDFSLRAGRFFLRAGSFFLRAGSFFSSCRFVFSSCGFEPFLRTRNKAQRARRRFYPGSFTLLKPRRRNDSE